MQPLASLTRDGGISRFVVDCAAAFDLSVVEHLAFFDDVVISQVHNLKSSRLKSTEPQITAANQPLFLHFGTLPMRSQDSPMILSEYGVAA
jgi:hypothetical protein